MASTAASRHIGSLPDLALLEVFANLSLVDLFISVPLVCTDWARLRRAALLRRKRLYIGSPETLCLRPLDAGVLPTEPPPETMVAINDYGVGDSLDWCCTSNTSTSTSSIIATTDVQLNTLPLLRSHKGTSSSRGASTTGALSTIRAVEQLTQAMPHLSELTVGMPMNVGEQAGAELINSLTRLLGHYTSTLTVLRVHIAPCGNSGSLVRVVNTLVRLRWLELNLNPSMSLRLDSTAPTTAMVVGELSPTLLARLRCLVLINSTISLLEQLTPNINIIIGDDHNHQPQPQVAIVCLGRFHQPDQALYRALQPVAANLRLLSLGAQRHGGIFDMDALVRQYQPSDAAMLSHGLHLRALTALQLGSCHEGPDRGLFHRVLARLATTAPVLVTLCLQDYVCLLARPNEDRLVEQWGLRPLRPRLPVLAAVRHLNLTYVSSVTARPCHSRAVRRLRLAQCFPRLERLELHLHFSRQGRCCVTAEQETLCEQRVLRALATATTDGDPAAAPPSLTEVRLNWGQRRVLVRHAPSPGGDIMFT